MTWPRLGERSATALIIICLTLIVSMTGALSRIDNVLFDTAQKHMPRHPPSDVVLVTIDEQSLSSLGRWPWSRRLHAQLIDRLHTDGAQVIGLDIVFAEPQQDDPHADEALAAAMGQAGNVILPVIIEKVRRNGQLIETLPLPAFVAKAAGIGRVHAELDADAVARSIHLREGLGQAVWPHFAQAMLSAAGQRTTMPHPPASAEPSTEPGTLIKREQRYINFSTAHHQLPTLSYVQVRQGQFSPGTFTGKVVLVGATATGMADSLPTPVSGYQQPMPGVEFLANVLISMRENTLIQRSPLWVNSALACSLALLPLLWLPYVSTRSGLLANTAHAALVMALAMVLPIMLHIWIPLSAALLGALSAYPLWAWRKLESASLFLDTELQRLHQQLRQITPAPGDASQLTRRSLTDRFERRIQQVRAATLQVQKLEESQRETLAFVSHDIRSPLASAAAQIKQDLGADHPAHQKLARALHWTEAFLQNARAQMLDSQTFKEIDIINTLHEVVDEIYPLAQSQGLTLSIDLPAYPVWVHGHAETLQRAIINLMSNALKYSPASGHVGLCAQLQEQQILITVSDQGPGIAPEDQERLFKRFDRPLQFGMATGAGLGLYFVHTVIHQHSGTVQFSRQNGHSCFSVFLPTNSNTENFNNS